MKNKLLFMMLTILGAPGIAAAAGYDLHNRPRNTRPRPAESVARNPRRYTRQGY